MPQQQSLSTPIYLATLSKPYNLFHLNNYCNRHSAYCIIKHEKLTSYIELKLYLQTGLMSLIIHVWRSTNVWKTNKTTSIKSRIPCIFLVRPLAAINTDYPSLSCSKYSLCMVAFYKEKKTFKVEPRRELATRQTRHEREAQFVFFTPANVNNEEKNKSFEFADVSIIAFICK